MRVHIYIRFLHIKNIYILYKCIYIVCMYRNLSLALSLSLSLCVSRARARVYVLFSLVVWYSISHSLMFRKYTDLCSLFLFNIVLFSVCVNKIM